MTTSAIRFISTLLLASFFLVACQSITVNPKNDSSSTANYQLNALVSVFETDTDTAFRASIQALDVLGYFRTGEIHGELETSVFARKVGDEKIVVKITELSLEQSQISVRVGITGNMPESQVILAEIEDIVLGL
jgi:outer membrane murein-binding lipoprotein Lpp